MDKSLSQTTNILLHLKAKYITHLFESKTSNSFMSAKKALYISFLAKIYGLVTEVYSNYRSTDFFQLLSFYPYLSLSLRK